MATGAQEVASGPAPPRGPAGGQGSSGRCGARRAGRGRRGRRRRLPLRLRARARCPRRRGTAGQDRARGCRVAGGGVGCAALRRSGRPGCGGRLSRHLLSGTERVGGGGRPAVPRGCRGAERGAGGPGEPRPSPRRRLRVRELRGGGRAAARLRRPPPAASGGARGRPLGSGRRRCPGDARRAIPALSRRVSASVAGAVRVRGAGAPVGARRMACVGGPTA